MERMGVGGVDDVDKPGVDHENDGYCITLSSVEKDKHVPSLGGAGVDTNMATDKERGETNPQDTGSSLPGSGSSLPTAGTGLPDSGCSLPDSASGLPDSASGLHDSASGLPDSGSTSAGHVNTPIFSGHHHEPSVFPIPLSIVQADVKGDVEVGDDPIVGGCKVEDVDKLEFDDDEEVCEDFEADMEHDLEFPDEGEAAGPLSGVCERRCQYCEFTHDHLLYVLTHEVLLHKESISAQLNGDVESRLSTVRRYTKGRKAGTHYNYVCYLCDVKLKSVNRFPHLINHVIQRDYQCHLCTYSHESEGVLNKHMTCHKNNEKHVLDLITLARDYILSTMPGGASDDVGSSGREADDATSHSLERAIERESIMDALTSDSSSVAGKECRFCGFYHPQLLYVLTHEVMLHGDVLTEGLTTDSDRLHILKRFFQVGKLPSGNYTYFCSLCNSKLKGQKRLTHFRNHANQRGVRCAYCTYCHTTEGGVIAHVECHRNSSKQMVDVLLSAKDYISSLQPSVDDSMEENEYGIKFSDAEPRMELQSLAPSFSVESQKGCKYCDFDHPQHIFVLTHEVLQHGDRISQGLEKDRREEILSRFTRVEDFRSRCLSYRCVLCEVNLTPINRLWHLCGHIVPRAVRCRFCTYSYDSQSVVKCHEQGHAHNDIDTLRAIMAAREHVDSNSKAGGESGGASMLDVARLDDDDDDGGGGEDVLGLDFIAEEKCEYCPFTHPVLIYTLTHEVVAHKQRISRDMRHERDCVPVMRRFFTPSHTPRKSSYYVCNLCNFKVVAARRLLHMGSHVEQKEFVCKFCTYSSDTREALFSHQMYHHESSNMESVELLLSAKRFVLSGSKRSMSFEIDNTPQPPPLETSEAASSRMLLPGKMFAPMETHPVTPVMASWAQQVDVMGRDNAPLPRTPSCSYCDFTNDSILIVLTHEVLCHPLELDEELSTDRGDVRELVRRRFICRSACILCGKSNDLGKMIFVRHLLHHIQHYPVKCPYCTYSAIKGGPFSLHIKMHEEGQGEVVRDSFKEAIAFVKDNKPPAGQSISPGIAQTLPEEKSSIHGITGKRKFSSLLFEEADRPASSLSSSSGSSLEKNQAYERSLFKCLFCDSEYENEIFTLSHEIVVHGHLVSLCLEGKGSICLERSRYFIYITNGTYWCKLCYRSISGEPDTCKHIQGHIQKSTYKCKYCTFSSANNLGPHSRMHDNQTTEMKDMFLSARKNAEYESSQLINDRSGDINHTDDEDAEKSEVIGHASTGNIAADEMEIVNQRETQSPKTNASYTSPLLSSSNSPDSIIAGPSGPPASDDITSTTNGSGNYSEDVLKCPFCAFMCNDKEIIIQHVISHNHNE